jgi:hypothetical protein
MTKSDYLQLRDRFTPPNPKIIFILESPPASGKYFYNPGGKTSEPLFRAMMKDVLEIEPTSKEEGLKEFAARGFLLIDATNTPVNRTKGKARDDVILGDFELLVTDLRQHAGPDTSIVLVKANICTLFESKLREAGFNVLNHGIVIPFPSSGQQGNFRPAIRQVLRRNPET